MNKGLPLWKIAFGNTTTLNHRQTIAGIRCGYYATGCCLFIIDNQRPFSSLKGDKHLAVVQAEKQRQEDLKKAVTGDLGYGCRICDIRLNSKQNYLEVKCRLSQQLIIHSLKGSFWVTSGITSSKVPLWTVKCLQLSVGDNLTFKICIAVLRFPSVFCCKIRENHNGHVQKLLHNVPFV